MDATNAALLDPPAEGDAPHTEPMSPPSTAEVAQVERDPAATSHGFLAFVPGQRKLTADQRAALAAIVNFDWEKDTAAIPHINVFAHLCQARGLDPFAREAYLIRRGKEKDTTYTMQVAIDGYRKMGQNTGRFIRRVGWFWAGHDDDDRSYEIVTVPGVGLVRRKVWDEVWDEERRGHPLLAKCVIEHYDENGERVYTEGVAYWSMFAPEFHKFHWGKAKGERIYEFHDDGSKVMELSEFWRKGPHHMLAKCAEAQAYRAAFPAAMSGIYTHEEMARLDLADRQRRDDDRGRRRAELAQQWDEPPARGDAPHGVIEGQVLGEMEHGETADRRSALLAELDHQARVLGTTVETMAARWRKANKKKEVEEATVAELEALVSARSAEVEQAVRRQGVDPQTGEFTTPAAVPPPEPTVEELVEAVGSYDEPPEETNGSMHAYEPWGDQPGALCVVCNGEPTDPAHQ